MVIAVMQPYLFPYLGYFQLLGAVDRFVLFDDVNFIKKGWINRNRILLGGEPHTFTVPLQDVSQNRSIRDHRISEEQAWAPKLLATIKRAYSAAPQFSEVFPALEDIFLQPTHSIADLAARSIRYVADRAKLPVLISSASDLHLGPELKGQERILAICAHQGAKCYINPASGAELYDTARFAERGMELRFLRMDGGITYPQIGVSTHVPALSIIDPLMHCTPAELRDLLQRYSLLTATELASPEGERPARSVHS